MTTDIDKTGYVEGAFKHTQFVEGAWKQVQENAPALSPLMKRAREKLWEALHGTPMRAGTDCQAFLSLTVALAASLVLVL